MEKRLKKQVMEGLAHEAATGMLAAIVRGAFARLAGSDHARISDIESKTKLALGFIRHYVETTPMMLAALLAAAKDAGIYDDVVPIFTAAEDYFLRSVDMIPDHLGLAGLIDDAYVAQSLMQIICDTHAAQTGYRLLTFDLADSNALMRRIIGEPASTELDASVQQVLALPDIQSAREMMTSRADRLTIQPVQPRRYSPASLDELDLQLGALGSG